MVTYIKLEMSNATHMTTNDKPFPLKDLIHWGYNHAHSIPHPKEVLEQTQKVLFFIILYFSKFDQRFWQVQSYHVTYQSQQFIGHSMHTTRCKNHFISISQIRSKRKTEKIVYGGNSFWGISHRSSLFIVRTESFHLIPLFIR